MGVVVHTAEQYARQLRQLLPPGKLWRLDADSALYKVLLAAADELGRIGQRAADLIEEADPRTTSELLPEFEAVLGVGSTNTEDERRAVVIAMLVRRQRFRPVDFQNALSRILSQDPADVVVIETSRADAIAMADDTAIFRFFIYRDPGEPGSYKLDEAQLMIDRMKPAHTAGFAIESIDFLCDDEFSLCDRDILGV